MAFNDKLKNQVRRRVVKTPRTATEVGQPLGKSGRGVGKVLAELVKDGDVVKHDSRPPKYSKAA